MIETGTNAEKYPGGDLLFTMYMDADVHGRGFQNLKMLYSFY